MSPSFFTSSVSNRSLRSLSRARGTISLSVNSRAVSWMRRCSSVSSKSIKCPPETSCRACHPTGARRIQEGKRPRGGPGEPMCRPAPWRCTWVKTRASPAGWPKFPIGFALVRLTRGGIWLAAVFTGMLVLASAAFADAPTFQTVRLPVPHIGDGTEPRVTVAPDGTIYPVTTDGTQGGPAVVFASKDGGATWTKTPADPPGQTNPTIDVDIVAMPTGRILASELDASGLNFPSGVSDDRGKTWTQSVGSTTIADQDRQWFAVGPNDPGSGKPTVYLLYHNLASGFANHNMSVAKSTDGGEPFGPPVPVAPPGSDAFNDLQCGDSGGPSDIFVDRRTGEVYAVFTTRSAQFTPQFDAGGCAAPATGQPIEINVVAGTRVWVARSKDGSPGSWSDSLAVDKSPAGNIVSMQLAYGALDTQGNIYVAYPESPNPFPDYAGSGIHYVVAPPDNDPSHALHWSTARTVKPEDRSEQTSHQLVHLAVGLPGEMSLAYYVGEKRPDGKSNWYATQAQTQDGLDPNPSFVEQRLSDVRTYSKYTPSEMMAACSDDNPAQGVENGFVCNRSTDVWGITLDNQCRTVAAWPTGTSSQTDEPIGRRGTYVSSQTGGPTLCEPLTKPIPAPFAGAAVNGLGSNGLCPDRVAPVTRLRKRDLKRRGTTLRLRGRSSDRGCAAVRGSRGKVSRVYVSVAKVRGKGRGQNCQFVSKRGKLTRARNCRRAILLRARGTSRWTFSLRANLPRGHYRVVARALDVARNKERPAKRRNILSFSVR